MRQASLAPLLECRSGAAAVEFGICMLLIVVLALGTMEVGRLFYHQHIMTKGVRDAARYLSRVPMDCVDDSGFAFTTEPFQTNARNLVLTGSLDGTAPVLSRDYNDPNTPDPDIDLDVTCIDNTAGEYYGPDYIPVVRVTARVQFTEILLDTIRALAGNTSPDPLTLSISHQEVSVGE